MRHRTVTFIGIVAFGTGLGATNPVALTQQAHRPIQVAVTVDDLPWIGRVQEGETRVSATQRLLATLKDHGIPAVGFVNCRRAKPDNAVLRMWLDAKLELGNHTSNHMDLNTVEPADWVDDAAECHEFLSGLLGHPAEYFRYPFLHEGPTIERQLTAREALDRLGYTNATVTIDNSEFMLASSDYVGPKGLSWIYRANAAAREKWASWDEQASMLRSRFREAGVQ